MAYFKNVFYRKKFLNKIDKDFKNIKNLNFKLLNFSKKQKIFSKEISLLIDNFHLFYYDFYIFREELKNINFKNIKINRELPNIYFVCINYISLKVGVLQPDSLIKHLLKINEKEILLDDEIFLLESMLKAAIYQQILKCYAKIHFYLRSYKISNKILKKEKNRFLINKKVLISEIKNQKIFYKVFYFILLRTKNSNVNYEKILKLLDKKININFSFKNLLKFQDIEKEKLYMLISNLTKSFQNIKEMDFNDIFEKVSSVHRTLCFDPAKVYQNMDRQSKDYYRACIKKVSKERNIKEIDVARLSVKLASRYKGNLLKKRHVGYYFVEQCLDKEFFISTKIKKKLYIVSVGLSSFALSFILKKLFCLIFLYKTDYLIFLFFLIISSEVSIKFMNFFLEKFAFKKIVPRMNISKIPNYAKTLVIVPTVLINKKDIFSLLEKIEIYKNANNYENLYFGILSDFKDSKFIQNNSNDTLVKLLEEKIKFLNEKYGNFYLLHRKKVYNKISREFVSFERKRGALNDLNSLILRKKFEKFSLIVGDKEVLTKIKYVITLDSDTRVLMESARDMVSAMLHPLNAPVIKKGKVYSGHAVMQPKIEIGVESANKTHFSKIISGPGGIGSYDTTSHDLFQSLFGEGTFFGKGIYNVKAFDEVVRDKIPENLVLSHDFVEGCYARAGALNITMLDICPSNFISYAKRLHRWIRGDLQNIRWIFGKIKNNENIRFKNPFCEISKWKIFNNLRRYVLNIILIFVFYLGFCSDRYKNLIWVGIFESFLPLFLYFTQKTLTIYNISWPQRFRSKIVTGLNEATQKSIFNILFFPSISFITVDAAAKSLYRTCFSKKKILEWTTFSESLQKKNSLLDYFKLMHFSVIYGFIILIKLKHKNNFFNFILPLSWIFAPFISKKISKIALKKGFQAPISDKKMLLSLAYKTWRYFDEFTNEENNFLTPDNFQIEPLKGASVRTSSTNIGMTLLSFMAAFDFGFISFKEMIQKTSHTIDSIIRLEKWRGHLYNWYDVKTLKALRPKTVSTVDNGNYISYIITLRQGFLEFLKFKNLTQNEFLNIKKIINFSEKTIKETKFEVFFNHTKKLFSIGFDIEKNELSNTRYDFLCSEARQLSFVAILNQEIEKQHWYVLSRKSVKHNFYRGLASWTGTMFEYLMPLLIMENIPNTLFSETYQFAVYCQIKNARHQKIPWGISESAYYAFDDSLSYLYKAFGVTELSINKEFVNNRVISPYSSVMALMVWPIEALKNIKNLINAKFLGKYGFYEAIDYTKKRLPNGSTKKIIKSFMTHHQAMILLSIDNFLNKNIMQKRFGKCIKVKAARELLEERIPVC